MLTAVIGEGTQLVCASHLHAHRDHFSNELVLTAGHVTRTGAVAAP
jgi:hypothetical protein